MPEISVIIPVFNTEAYIRDCLKSVCRASVFDKCEVIVIDDGSTDGSARIIQEFVNQYSNIFLYTHENAGPGRARNRGMACARGKYFFFLDSDDFIEERYLEKLYFSISSTDCDIVFAGFTQVDETGKHQNAFQREILNTRNVLCGCEYLERRIDLKDWHNEGCCALYRRDFLLKYDITFDKEIILYEDILFTNYALLCAKRVCAIPEYGYRYRVREHSLVHSGLSEKDAHDLLLVLDKFMLLCDSCTVEQKHVAGRMYFELLSMLLYDIGAVNPSNKNAYYQKIKNCGVITELKKSCGNWKERMKLLIFSAGLQWYYPIIRIKELVSWRRSRK